LIVSGATLAGCEAQLRTEPVYATTQPPPPPASQPYQPAPPAVQPAPVQPGWVTLADAYSADSERQFINLLGRGGEFHRLRIEGVRGAPVITRVAIEYMDRDMQVVDLNQRLSRGEDEVIRLNGRGQRINRIIVYTDPARGGGKYSVFGT
jgi:hypothetical protein